MIRSSEWKMNEDDDWEKFIGVDSLEFFYRDRLVLGEGKGWNYVVKS